MKVTFPKPLLAHSKTPVLDSIKYPVLMSPKLDGIRCILIDGVPHSRAGKVIPNLFVQRELKDIHNNLILDGELMVDGDFNSVQSAIMSNSGEPDFTFNVFDVINTQGFSTRLRHAQNAVETFGGRLRLVYHSLVTNAEQAAAKHKEYCAAGYEGSMVRRPDGEYKHGRSTAKQGILLKIKDFSDDEAVILDVKQLARNLDTSTKCLHNLVYEDAVGSFTVRWKGKIFNVGSGLKAAQRRELYAIKDKLVGKTITFTYQEVTTYGVPRFPVFKGFRGDL